jgi:hypothetical protein
VSECVSGAQHLVRGLLGRAVFPQLLDLRHVESGSRAKSERVRE